MTLAARGLLAARPHRALAWPCRARRAARTTPRPPRLDREGHVLGSTRQVLSSAAPEARARARPEAPRRPRARQASWSAGSASSTRAGCARSRARPRRPPGRAPAPPAGSAPPPRARRRAPACRRASPTASAGGRRAPPRARVARRRAHQPADDRHARQRLHERRDPVGVADVGLGPGRRDRGRAAGSRVVPRTVAGGAQVAASACPRQPQPTISTRAIILSLARCHGPEPPPGGLCAALRCLDRARPFPPSWTPRVMPSRPERGDLGRGPWTSGCLPTSRS